MNNGSRFAVAGYDVVATAQSADGGGPPDTAEWIVLNNNSSHFLVAHRETDAPSAVLVDAFRYDDRYSDDDDPEGHFGYAVAVYRKAVRLMVDLALSH